MAGIALLSDLLKRSSSAGTSSTKSLYQHGILSATVTASIAGFTASRGFFGEFPVAFCDADVEWKDENIPYFHGSFTNSLHRDDLKHSTKEYPIELKPLFSAFGLKSFAITSLRSFLMFYLPLLEPRPPVDEDDDLLEDTEDGAVDLVVPFKKSVKQIVREVLYGCQLFSLVFSLFLLDFIRESDMDAFVGIGGGRVSPMIQTSITTTRRVLERFAVHYLSPRMAWKLLKDIPRSARRKALRGLPTATFFYCVGKSTFRGHILGVAASWIVQIGIEIYRCFFAKPEYDGEELNGEENVRLFGKKISGTTIKCCSSLAFASVGAGLGALFHPSIGQWIGSALGDFAGPIFVTICLERYVHLDN